VIDRGLHRCSGCNAEMVEDNDPAKRPLKGLQRLECPNGCSFKVVSTAPRQRANTMLGAGRRVVRWV